MDTVETAQSDLDNITNHINDQVKTFQALPNQYKDLLPGAKEKAIASAQKSQIDSAKKYLRF